MFCKSSRWVRLKFLTSFSDTACRYQQEITQWSNTKFGAQAAVQIGHYAQSFARMCCIKMGLCCSKMRNKLGISRKEYRHVSCIKCIVCDVHLCLNKERNSYQIYHTEVEY